MKNNILKSVVAMLLYVAFAPKTFSQLVSCPPGSCGPDSCYDRNVVVQNTTPCEMCWLWSYPGTDCSQNPGGCVDPGKSRTYVAPCAKCNDGPCQCPDKFWLADPGSATGYATAIDLVSTGIGPQVYIVDYSSCCGGHLKITFTPAPSPLPGIPHPPAHLKIECL